DHAKIILGKTMFDEAEIKPPKAATRRSILFMSRFEKRKGCLELLEAFALLAPRFPDLDLIMAGDGPEAHLLNAKVAQHGLLSRVFLPGYVSGDAKADFLATSTIFALPTTHQEGMPIALLEAMAAGKPILTTKAGGIPRLIQEPENGLFLEDVSPEAIAEGLRRLLNDFQLCRAMSQRNASDARAYAAPNVVAEIEDAYRAIRGGA
ncbi:MAG TPA: glycosyltransferase family 4 protein, partial [Alphaproteobacteria bacterium]|nr:glycosyltransferase family 4 protein [Alphaproteobacteria bacterium]